MFIRESEDDTNGADVDDANVTQLCLFSVPQFFVCLTETKCKAVVFYLNSVMCIISAMGIVLQLCWPDT